MPCDPNDIEFNIPDGPSGFPIPNFGVPFALKLPETNLSMPDGIPSDLLDIFEKLQFLFPSGKVNPGLSYNFQKDPFDGIFKLLDYAFPFLVMYKFFLPILDLIICIIEVICSLNNPRKVIRAVRRLFRVCLPAFLNLFPMFALIAMILSILFLILSLLEYLIIQILKLINLIRKNLQRLYNVAFKTADEEAILATASKIGTALCIFQNIFVLVAVIGAFIQIIQDILDKLFKIPPCEDSNSDGCCTSDVCPSIAKNSYNRTTGYLKYLNTVTVSETVGLSSITKNLRNSSWQIYDPSQELLQQFINITQAQDVPAGLRNIYFPVDSKYDASTTPKQAPYTIDLRLYYDPTNFGRIGTPRYIKFVDCIVTTPGSDGLYTYDNTISAISTGVLLLAGGKGYEDDGTTVLKGYSSDGITQISSQATLENFILIKNKSYTMPPSLPLNALDPTDGYLFSNIEYSFKPNHEVLYGKNIITAGCEPDFSFDKMIINSTIGAQVNFKVNLLNNIEFPDMNKLQECLNLCLNNLRNDLTEEGLNNFLATCTACIDDTKTVTIKAIKDVISAAYDQYKSVFTLDPIVQFTTRTIKVQLDLRDTNNLPITENLTKEIANEISAKIIPEISFGEISKFNYDGSRYFEAEISSKKNGKGTISIAFDSKKISTLNISEDLDVPPSVTVTELEYEFIDVSIATVPQVGTGDLSDGSPRRDVEDLSNAGDNKGVV